MNLTLLALFIPACFALNLAPGPNNLLSLSNAARYGFRAACLAGAGRLLAFVGMLALASMGLATVLHLSAALFMVIKVLGAAYLFYLAVQLWRAVPVADAPAQPFGGAGLMRLARQEFWVAAGNPKAILIFTAFLPQFVEPGRPVAGQFAVLGTLFLVLELLAIAIYAFLGLRAGRWLGSAARKQRFNRGCAVLLGCAGLGLLAARRG